MVVTAVGRKKGVLVSAVVRKKGVVGALVVGGKEGCEENGGLYDVWGCCGDENGGAVELGHARSMWFH